MVETEIEVQKRVDLRVSYWTNEVAKAKKAGSEFRTATAREILKVVLRDSVVETGPECASLRAEVRKHVWNTPESKTALVNLQNALIAGLNK